MLVCLTVTNILCLKSWKIYEMYKVKYYIQSTAIRFKAFETLHEATKFANKQPIDSIIEITYYEGSNNNGPAFWSEE